MRVTSRQLRHIIQQTLHEIASDENDEEALDEDEAWTERGEWPIVQEPGSPPPLSRREREAARPSTRPASVSKPVLDPAATAGAYGSGPPVGGPFDPTHRGEFPAWQEEPEEESEEEPLSEGSMTMTATQLRQLIREAAMGERVPDEHRWPDDARAQLWDIIKAVEAGQLDHPTAESQVLQIIEPIEGGPLPPSIYGGPKGIQRLRVHLEEQEIPGVEVEYAAEAVLDADGVLTTSTLFDFLRAQGHQDHLISRAVDLATRARFSWVPDEWRSTGALNEMFGGQRSNPPRGGYGPLTLYDVVKAFQNAGFHWLLDGQAKEIAEKLNADGRNRRDLEQRLARLTPYEGRSVYNAIDAVKAG